MQILKILPILLTLPMTLMGMERDGIKYDKVPIIQQRLVTSMEAGQVDPGIKAKIKAASLTRDDGKDTSIEMHENNSVFYTKKLGEYNIELEEIDIENRILILYPKNTRNIGTQVSTFSPEPFKDVLRKSVIESIFPLIMGSLTGIAMFTLSYKFYME